MSIKSRLARLESKTGGKGYTHIITGPADSACDADTLLRDAGMVKGPSDLVIYIKEFGQNSPPARYLSSTPMN